MLLRTAEKLYYDRSEIRKSYAYTTVADNNLSSLIARRLQGCITYILHTVICIDNPSADRIAPRNDRCRFRWNT